MDNARGNQPRNRRNRWSFLFPIGFPLNNYKYLFFVILLISLVIIPTFYDETDETPKPRKWSAIFILGDSTVHCRRSSSVGSVFDRDDLFFPCNGSQPILIPEMIAEKMGFRRMGRFGVKDVVPILNFGSSIATIRGNPDPLNLQIERALDSIKLLEVGMSQADLKDFMESTLFYLSIGKNDYLRLFSMDYYSDGLVKFGPERYAQDLVNVMVKAIKELYFSGAKKIVCMGIAPLGCSPRVMYESHGNWIRSGGYGGCVDELNDFIIEYNSMLSKKLSMLGMELEDLNIVYCDVYTAMMKVIVYYPYGYGFTQVSQPCCGSAQSRCISESMVCEEASTHVWWDFYDPTEAVNRLLADSIWSNQAYLGPLCRPLSIHQLAYI